MLSDLRYALRVFGKNPGFTTAAVLTLALGIGATTAIFSMADAVLLRAPPVHEPDRLAVIYTTCRRGDLRCSSSYPDYVDYRDRSRSFGDMAAYSWVPLNVGDGSSARLATGQMVTGNYFSLFGLTPAIGRLVVPDDDARANPQTVAVVSHVFWTDFLGADRDAVGTEIRLNGTPYTIVGVAPAGFTGADLGGEPDLWLPMFTGGLLGDGVGSVGEPDIFDSRGNRWIHAIIGRLAHEASIEQAQAEMLAISDGLRELDPEARGPRSVTVEPLGGYILPLGRSRAELVRFVTLLVATVGIALLLASANLANLLLSRALARQREMGIRLAVGAGRIRLVRQLLTESLTLAVGGGLAGLIVATWLLDVLAVFELPGGVVVRTLDVHLDGRMLVIAMALSTITGVLFGLVPAWQSTHTNLSAALKGENRAVRGPRQRLRKALVGIQVALCLVLLVGAAVFLRTLRHGMTMNPGFDDENVAVANFNLSLVRYSPERATGFIDDLLERARGLPGVEAASVATLVPMQQGGFLGTFVEVDGYEPAPDERIRVDYAFVGPDFFRALGVPLREGRGFTAGDRGDEAPVAVVNEFMAQRYWPDGPVVGGRLHLGERTFNVIGVAGDLKWRRLTEDPTPYVFFPIAQSPTTMAQRSLTLVVRGGDGDVRSLLPLIQQRIRELDPDLSLANLEPLRTQVRRVLMPQRMGSLLLVMLGALAVVLAVIGIYGVVAYAASEQTRAIGVRMALGATRNDIVRLMAREGTTPLLLGLGAGGAGGLVLTRALQRFTIGASAVDPLAFGAATIVLVSVASLATLIPARRAAGIDPMAALRSE